MSGEPPDLGELDLPLPQQGMAPEGKGVLLLRYVSVGRSVVGLDFSEASLCQGAPLDRRTGALTTTLRDHEPETSTSPR